MKIWELDQSMFWTWNYPICWANQFSYEHSGFTNYENYIFIACSRIKIDWNHKWSSVPGQALRAWTICELAQTMESCGLWSPDRAWTICELAQTMRWNCPVSPSNSLACKNLTAIQTTLREAPCLSYLPELGLNIFSVLESLFFQVVWKNLWFFVFHPESCLRHMSEVHFSFVGFC